MTESAAHVRVIEETPAYWRVVFDYPPFNIVDATIFEGLQELLARMDARPSLCVVVFESANPYFYLAHFDLTGVSAKLILDCSFQKEYKGYLRQHEWRARKSSIQMKSSTKPWRFSGRAVTRERQCRIW